MEDAAKENTSNDF